MPLISFAQTSDTVQLGYTGERVINYFVRIAATEGRGRGSISDAILIGASGLKSFAKHDTPITAMCEHEGAIYYVTNNALYMFDGFQSSVVGGVHVPDGENAKLLSAITWLAILSDGGLQLYKDGVATTVTTGAVEVARDIATIDGYLIVSGEGEGVTDIMSSANIDPLTIDLITFKGADNTKAEENNDRIVGIVVDHNLLWAFGKKTTEVFYNDGSLNFPLTPNVGLFLERGCLSRDVVAKEDNSVFWIGEDRVVYRSSGQAPTVVSNRDIEDSLEQSNITRAYILKDRGHKFYVISRQDDTSLCYDMTTGLWSERSIGINHDSYPGIGSVELNGRIYVGTSTGHICELDRDTYDLHGEVMNAEAVSTPIVTDGSVFTVSRIHLNVNSGSVKTLEDPRIMLQTSKDGRTWGAEKWRDLKILGDYFTRAVWNGLGSFRRFQVRLRITARVPRDIYGVTYV